MSSPRSIDVHAHCVPVGVIETLVAEGGRYGIELTRRDGRYAALIGGRVQTRDILPSLSDLPRRLAEGLPLNPPRPETFYGGDAEGYTDYPAYGAA